MISWGLILIIAVVLVVAVLIFKFQIKRIKATIAIVILVFVLITLIGWYRSGDADFSSPSNSIHSVYLYFSWVGEASRGLFNFGKNTVSIVGNTVKGNYTMENLLDGRR